MRTQKDIFSAIKTYLIENADTIQKQATEHHKELLGGDVFRTELIGKYQKNHVRVVHALAKHLETLSIQKGLSVFSHLGETMAKDAVRDSLTIEEATDGIIFLKQVVWKMLEAEGFIKQLTTEQFYELTQTTGTYVDVVVSKIAFEFHHHYTAKKEQQEKHKNEFIGLISHELKTPVTSVKVFAQVLRNRFAKAGDMKSATLLMKMDAQLNKLSNLIADILDVTKIETGKLQFHRKVFDFSEVVTETVEEMQRTTERHTITITSNSSIRIFGDRDRIGQVMVNLLTNAIKYSPNADTIIVSTKVTDDSVTLSIQDYGIGIPKEAQKKVFDQFYRVAGKNEQTFSGMGLGLYVCAEIIKRHSGRIWVESEKGKGSLFCFTLPAGRRTRV